MRIVDYINLSMQLWGCFMTLIAFACLKVTKYKKNKTLFLYKSMIGLNTFVMLFDIITIFCNKRNSSFLFFLNKAGNTMSYICNYMLLATFVHFLTELILSRTKISKTPLIITRLLSVTSSIAVLVNWWFPIFFAVDSTNTYYRVDYFWVSQSIGVFCLLLCLYLVIRYKKFLHTRQSFLYWTYITFPIISLLVQMFTYGLVVLNIMDTVLLMFGFVVIESEVGKKMVQQELLLANQEKKMSEDRLAITISQLQPHFLNNTLNAIYHLCDKDTALAKKTIKNFSTYLRNNLDAISLKKPIPFDVELEHIKKYLSIEQLRFGDNLNITYNIETTKFLLPALSTQPIVENAVVHGICKKEDGGTVNIATCELENCFQVVISDNGIGFDTKEKKEDGRSHVGVENVRERLKVMCGGSLEIESTVGLGTKATITIPKGDMLK